MFTIPGKIPITIRPLFWLIAAFIGWMVSFTLTKTLVAVFVILFSVLFHEFGHALTGILFGQKVRIELAAFGGFTYREGRKLKLWEEFLVVLNGPVAGFLLFVVAHIILTNFAIENAILKFALEFTRLANLFWTVINLVPVLPLDGGHLLSIVLEAIFGFRGIKMAIFIGLFISVTISIFFFVIGAFLVGALFLILTFESFRSLRYYKLLTEKDRDSDLQILMRDADRHFQAGDHDKALRVLQQVRDAAKEGILYTMATQEMAQIYRERKEYDKAYDLLAPIRKTLSGETLALFHFVAYMHRDYKTVKSLSSEAYQFSPTSDTALINALASGALGEVEPAIGWLRCAQREGLRSLQDALSHPELDPIREDPRFRSFLHTQSA